MNNENEIELIKLVELKQEKNKILCDATNLVTSVGDIVSFYLVYNNQVVERQKTSKENPKTTFNASNGDGLYTVNVWYIDNFNERKVLSLKINVEIIQSLDTSQLISLVNVINDHNQINCNTSKITKYINEIISYTVYRDGVLIRKRRSTLFEYSFEIDTSGLYKIKIEYQDLDDDKQEIVFEYFFSYETNYHVISKSPVLRKKSLLFNIIYAFVIREFQRKYDKGYFRYFSIVLGPTIQLAIMVLIFTLMGRKSVLGINIPLFVLTGILPYGFFTSAGNCLTIITANKVLLNYKHVKIIDTIIASIIMELLVTITIFCCGIILIWYFDMRVVLYNPISLILAFTILFTITFALAMILSVIGFYFAEFNYAIQIIFRAFFYTSGVFFSINTIPVQYQKFFLWNPLFQVIEFIRYSFVGFTLPHELSYIYLMKFTIMVLTLGVSLYFVNRNKFLINDRARI